MAEDNFAMGYALGQDSNGNGNGNGMWGNDGWWAIILFAMIFGWGNGGFGGFGGGNGGGYTAAAATQADIQRGFDTQAIVGKLDGLSQGLCDGFYAMNTGMLTGFNNTNVAMMQGFNGVQSQLCNMAAQNQACCCETQRLVERGFADTNYNLATQACDTRNTIQNATRDIIDSQNAGTRAILDFLTQDKISTLTAENQSLKFQASQAAQNAFFTANQDAQTAELIRRIAPMPVPAYAVPAPYPYCGGYGNYGCNNGCGCNTGCGC